MVVKRLWICSDRILKLNSLMLQWITCARSVYSYSPLASHDIQRCGLFKAMRVTRAQERRWRSGYMTPGQFRTKPLQSCLEISHLMRWWEAPPHSALERTGTKNSSVLHHVAEALPALLRRMLFQADHWHPGRPITISVSLTTMPKIPWATEWGEAT